MIDVPVYDRQGKQVDSVSVDENALGGEVRPALLKQAYVMFHANRRQGSARTRNRANVDGSTRKLYKQKGTGNARPGPRRTPIRKGGGVTFAKTRTREDFRLKMPRKMRRLANRNALLAKLVDGEVKCMVDMDFDEPSTKAFRDVMKTAGIDRTCLVALDPEQVNAALSARNIEDCSTIRVDQLNAFELLNHRYLLIDKAGLEAFLDGSVWAKSEEAA